MPTSAAASAFENGRAAISDKDYDKALGLLRPLAEAGHPGAQNALGILYRNGWGVARDDHEAVAWFRKAASKGEPKAQFNLAEMYLDGRGVPRDPEEAARWHARAAEQGHAVSQAALASMYGRGEGVAYDASQAMAWYRKAAAQDFAAGQLGVGDMLLQGEGVASDPAEARRWFELAAAQGHPVAQFRLATLHLTGRGAPRDFDQAARWMKAAVERWRQGPLGVPQIGALLDAGVDRDVILLLRAIDLPAETLADSLLALQTQSHWAQRARQGVEVVTTWDGHPVRWNASNSQEWVARVDERLSLYSAAARQRGFPQLGGRYRTMLQGSCERLGFVPDESTVEQDGYWLRLSNDRVRGVAAYRGAAVESSLVVRHGMIDEISLAGQAADGRIVLRPADTDCVVTLSKDS